MGITGQTQKIDHALLTSVRDCQVWNLKACASAKISLWEVTGQAQKIFTNSLALARTPLKIIFVQLTNRRAWSAILTDTLTPHLLRKKSSRRHSRIWLMRTTLFPTRNVSCSTTHVVRRATYKRI